MPYSGEQRGAVVVVQSLRDPVVVLRRVVQGKVEILATLGGASHRQQPTGALGVHGAPAALEPRAALAAHLDTGARASELDPILGDDVDHAEEGIGAVDGGTGAGQKFDALNQIDIDGEVGPNSGLVKDIVVVAYPVDEQENAGVVVARRGEAAHAQVVVAAVVAGVEPAHAVQNVCQRAVAEGTDVLGCYHAHGCGRPQQGGVVAARRAHLHLHECLQRKAGDVFAMGGQRASVAKKRAYQYNLRQDAARPVHAWPGPRERREMHRKVASVAYPPMPCSAVAADAIGTLVACKKLQQCGIITNQPPEMNEGKSVFRCACGRCKTIAPEWRGARDR